MEPENMDVPADLRHKRTTGARPGSWAGSGAWLSARRRRVLTMSSMETSTTLRKALLGGPCCQAVLVASVACHAQRRTSPAPRAWEFAGARLIAQSQGPLAAGGKPLATSTSSDRFGCTDYAGFILGLPGLSGEGQAAPLCESRRLARQTAASSVAAYFDTGPTTDQLRPARTAHWR